MDIRWLHPETVWYLHAGGRTPLMFAGDGIVLVDRNILTSARRMIAGGGATSKGPAWWLNFLNAPSYTMNPVLAAAEGCGRELPSLQEFIANLEGASSTLAMAFPNSAVERFGAAEAEKVYHTMAGISQQTEGHREFLIAAAPLIAHRNPPSRLRQVEDKLFHLAADAGIRCDGLTFIAALSCLYERRDGRQPRIGRGVLKPKTNYSDADAYNALADVTSVSLLAMSATLPARIGLVTQDRWLAAFWCALGVSIPDQGPVFTRLNVTPDPDLFPALDLDGIAELFGRLREASSRPKESRISPRA